MKTLRSLFSIVAIMVLCAVSLTVTAPDAEAATSPSFTLLQRSSGPTATANRATFYMDSDDNYVYLQIDGGTYYKVTNAGQIQFHDPQSVTTADDGAGTSPAATITPTRSVVHYTCSDTDGCTVAISESGAISGQVLRVVNIGANTATFADSSGVTETAGALAAGQWDSISYQYVVDRWVEVGRSNN